MKLSAWRSWLLLVFLVWESVQWCYINRISHSADVYSAQYSPDGKLIVFATADQKHYTFSATSAGYPTVDFYNPGSNSYSAKFSPNQQYIAYGLTNGSVIIHSNSYTYVQRLNTAFQTIQQVDFNMQSSLLLVCGSQGGGSSDGFHIYNVPAWTVNYTQTNYTSGVLSCRFSQNGSYATGSNNGYIRYYSSNNVLQWSVFTTSSTQINGLDFSPNNSNLATVWGPNGQQNVGIYNVLNGANIANINVATDLLKSVDYSENGAYLAFAGYDNKVYVYNGTNPSNSIITLTEPTQDVFCVDFSYDSNWLIASSKDNKVYIYKMDCTPEKAAEGLTNCPLEQYLVSVDTCKMCAQDIPGCRLCTNGTVCLVCSDQYYLSTSSKQCTMCINNMTGCISCTNSSYCFQCLTTYYLDSGKCSLCYSAIPGCVQCSNASACFQCAQHSYYLNSTSNSCVACSVYPYCIYCNSTGCVTCKPNYYANGGVCNRCHANCSSCSDNSTNCQSCRLGYYLSGVLCLPCQGSCFTCSNDTKCLTCIQGYYLNGNLCNVCSVKCSICYGSLATQCYACNIGYYLTGSTCSSCTLNCALCLNSTDCLSCLNGYYLNGTSCISCTSIHSSCLFCTNSTCLECGPGYTISGSSCSNCQSLIPGCQLCANSTVCSLCVREYYLVNNTCLVCPFPCLTCSSNGSCLTCALGYYVNSSLLCAKCSCPTCNSSSYCLTCSIGSYLSSGLCRSCSSIHSMCMNCIDASTCSECFAPYYLHGFTCSICALGCTSCNATSCMSCDVGYYYSSGACHLCAGNCSACNSSSTCTMCVVGYYLSGTSCLDCFSHFPGCLSCNSSVCFQCSYFDGYYLNSTVCSQCYDAIPGCYSCLNSSVCKVCLISYSLNSSGTQCLPCNSIIPHCQLCSNSSFCISCTVGYYSSNGVCTGCSNGCYSCYNGTVCTKCLNQFWLNGNDDCDACEVAMMGCKTCSSLSTCTQCLFGYYLDTGSCIPCLADMRGCLACSNSTLCIACQSGYYLDSSGHCLGCQDNMTGCAFCRAGGVCDRCGGGYYLISGQCSLCSDPNCLTCSNSSCLDCKSGFFLNSTACYSCLSSFTGCIFCNISRCLSCQSGYFLNSTICSLCPGLGCEVCLSSHPSQCVSCNKGYYLHNGTCNLCLGAMAGCESCSSGTVCLDCSTGYHLNAGACNLCSSSMTACTSCLNSSVCYICNNGYLLVNDTCHRCGLFLNGCAFCQVDTICLACLQGYYLNTSTNLCSSCPTIQGCLICRDASTCNFCQDGYFLQGGLCRMCNSTLTGCAACSSSSVCKICHGNYYLSGSKCVIYTMTEAYYPYDQLSLKSKYINASTLSHTLWVKGTEFNYTSEDLSLHANISYLTDSGVIVNLTVIGFEWGRDRISITFFTNNPFDFSKGAGNTGNMGLFNMRLLQEKKQERNLQYSSSIELNADFRLAMDEYTVLTLLPYATHGGNLFLSYNVNNPEFIASLYGSRSYYYHYFGLFVCLYLAFFYFVKAVVADPEGTDKGQMIAHVLFMKTIVLMVFPAYDEMIDYCAGYMVADLPWLNTYFGQYLADVRDVTPLPYLLFFVSLSLASTYLLATSFIAFAAICLGLLAYVKEQYRPILKNIGLFFYNFFLGGLSFASICCVQGAFLNLASQFTAKSSFYLMGMIIFMVLLGDAVWSSCKDRSNLFKVRVLMKAGILSILHYGPLYLCSVVIASEIFFLFLQWKIVQFKFPKEWLAANILPNISLLLLVEFSHSLISIYIASILILGALVLEFVILVREFRLSKLVGQLKIQKMDEKNHTFFKTLGVLNKEEEKHQIGLIGALSDNNEFILSDNVVEVKEKAILNDSQSNFFALDQMQRQ